MRFKTLVYARTPSGLIKTPNIYLFLDRKCSNSAVSYQNPKGLNQPLRRTVKIGHLKRIILGSLKRDSPILPLLRYVLILSREYISIFGHALAYVPTWFNGYFVLVIDLVFFTTSNLLHLFFLPDAVVHCEEV